MPITLTLVLLAGAMQGEAEGLGPDAALAVGHVALNRLASPDFPNILQDVISLGFYGWKEPSAEYLGLARQVLAEPDTTGGCLYALSLQDRRLLGFPPGDLVFGRYFFQLHCYRDWGHPIRIPRPRAPVDPSRYPSGGPG